jgi:hypothetical protein
MTNPWACDDVGKSNCGEDGFFCDNRLKQNKLRSSVMGQLRISGLRLKTEN